ncbi:MAG: LPS assembly protein LptD [Nitrospirota bacterium]|nr:LPS assembly protein LptD [Nitrospirota bacterium]
MRSTTPDYNQTFRNSRDRRGSILRCSLIIVLLLFLHVSFPSGSSAAETPRINMTSDSLDYFFRTKTYVATGSVELERDDVFIKTDKASYNDETSDFFAEGDVLYEDKDTTIRAEKAWINLESETGKLYKAEVFYKKGNYYLSGKEIEKRGGNYFYSPEASFTTCDAAVPAWCFRGRKIDAVIGERLKARDVTFHIKNVPVLYTPYLWTPVITERQTGFLMPVVRYSRTRGFSMNIPFYWAIAENRDATLVLDTYSRRGTGAGIEYRFVKPGGIESSWWVYYIRDIELNKDFWEIRARHENRPVDGPGGFLNINFVNEGNFYREFSPQLELRTQRFLESTAELSVPSADSRLYLLSQYWVDMKYDTGDVPQRLPEIGYVLNYRKTGGFMLSTTANAVNLWRENAISARRLDIYPKLLYSTGKDYVLSSMLAARWTAYSYFRNSGITDNSPQRSAFEYNVVARTRIFRDYAYLRHVIEPSVRYHFISTSEQNLPVFDSTELFGKTSRIELSLLNRLIFKGEKTAAVRVTQGFEAYNGDRPFLPLTIEAYMEKFIPLQLDVAYDVHTGKVETLSSNLRFQFPKAGLSVGQRYNREEDIMLYTTAFDLDPYKSVHIQAKLWYDAKGDGVRDIDVNLKYSRQCWGIRFEYSQKPGDYAIMVLFELRGFTQS